ncbi:hypothetical protein TcBrA4_0104990 [Trypanosoma cruzi]|nr:hypothetical protein TcBrA4_0104990 [Trypanosoma cruzi]
MRNLPRKHRLASAFQRNTRLNFARRLTFLTQKGRKALDVKVALCALGYDVSKEELTQLLKQVGGSIVGGVDFNEFYCVLLAKMMQRESRSEAIRAFRLIDVAEKGFR